MLKFNVPSGDNIKIAAICDRAWNQVRASYQSKLDLVMDITVTHANGCRLDLDKFLAAPDFDFYHDITGIRDCLNRRTGKMRHCFLPRAARP